MLNESVYDLLRVKIASMEYAPGSHFSEMDLAKELGTPRSTVREAFSRLAQDNLVQIIPQHSTTIRKLELANILDSIFIIRSILIAILKDFHSHSIENTLAVTHLRDKLITIEKCIVFYEDDFFAADYHFYLTLSGLNGFPRLNKIIFKEKLNIDRTLRLSVKRRSDYIPIATLYRLVLDGLISGTADKSIKAICELATTLEKYARAAAKNHPNLFT